MTTKKTKCWRLMYKSRSFDWTEFCIYPSRLKIRSDIKYLKGLGHKTRLIRVETVTTERVEEV